MTLRLVADENFDNDILHGVLRRTQGVDFVRVQDVGLRGADDPTVLQWAAEEGRILVTHDISTIPDFAYQRLAGGLAMPGVFVLPTALPIGAAIEELTLLTAASEAAEWDQKVTYLPLH